MYCGPNKISGLFILSAHQFMIKVHTPFKQPSKNKSSQAVWHWANRIFLSNTPRINGFGPTNLSLPGLKAAHQASMSIQVRLTSMLFSTLT